MNTNIAYTLPLILFLLGSRTDAEIDISNRENGIRHQLRVKADDVVIVRSVPGPTAVLRFISLTETNVSLIWCYLGDSPETTCSDVQTVPLTVIPGGERKTPVPGTRNVRVETGVHSEVVLKAGDVTVTLSRSVDGSFGLEYFREKARLDLLPAGLSRKSEQRP